MLEFITDIDVWSIISGILGILGFVISVITLVNYYLSKRTKIEFTLIDYSIREYIGGSFRVFIHYKITNESELPIAITDICLLINNKTIFEDLNTHKVSSYYEIDGNGTSDYVPTYNEHLPINLASLQSHSCYLVYVVEKDMLSTLGKDLSLRIRTNHKKEWKTTLSKHQMKKFR